MPRGVTAQRLRSAVISQVEATSLRHAAREIGMTASGLQGFLDGREPRASTIRKLQTWYVRWFVAGRNAIDLETATAALLVLTWDLPVGARDTTEVQVVELLESRYDAAKTSRPMWLKELRIRLSGGMAG